MGDAVASDSGLAGGCAARGYSRLEELHEDADLPFRILWGQCDEILGEYRKLAFDFPQVARLPLNRASKPEFGAVWDYPHVTMHRLKYELYNLLFYADMAWEGKEYQPSSLLQEEQTLVIVDLIRGLERLLVGLRKKSK